MAVNTTVDKEIFPGLSLGFSGLSMFFIVINILHAWMVRDELRKEHPFKYFRMLWTHVPLQLLGWLFFGLAFKPEYGGTIPDPNRNNDPNQLNSFISVLFLSIETPATLLSFCRALSPNNALFQGVHEFFFRPVLQYGNTVVNRSIGDFAYNANKIALLSDDSSDPACNSVSS